MRYFMSVSESDATAVYFCHPWAAVRKGLDGALSFESCVGVKHDMYNVVENVDSGTIMELYSSDSDSEYEVCEGSNRGNNATGSITHNTRKASAVEFAMDVQWSDLQPAIGSDAEASQLLD